MLDQHLHADGELDHAKLRETVRVAVRALDDVIDVNFYPTEPARTANMRHRPVGLGVMGLQYALYARGPRVRLARRRSTFGDEVMEAIAFYAYEASSDLAAERGALPVATRARSGTAGCCRQDTVDLLDAGARRGDRRAARRRAGLGAAARARSPRQGMRNSNVIAIAPTATIANIMGTSPCIEPMYKNLFAKSNLSGDFMVLNPFLVRDLKAAGLWTRELADAAEVPRRRPHRDRRRCPAELRERYRTAFQIDARVR